MGSRTNPRQRDNKGQVLWHVRPYEVNDEGKWAFGPTGYLTSVIGQWLMPPDMNDMDARVLVIAQQPAIGLFEQCPSCDSKISEGRLAFSAGDFVVYPCIDCEEWVWTEKIGDEMEC